jgi:hypothetical protein
MHGERTRPACKEGAHARPVPQNQISPLPELMHGEHTRPACKEGACARPVLQNQINPLPELMHGERTRPACKEGAHARPVLQNQINPLPELMNPRVAWNLLRRRVLRQPGHVRVLTVAYATDSGILGISDGYQELARHPFVNFRVSVGKGSAAAVGQIA